MQLGDLGLIRTGQIHSNKTMSENGDKVAREDPIGATQMSLDSGLDQKWAGAVGPPYQLRAKPHHPGIHSSEVLLGFLGRTSQLVVHKRQGGAG